MREKENSENSLLISDTLSEHFFQKLLVDIKQSRPTEKKFINKCKMSLKSLIKSHLDDGKVFYSLELTPKTGLTVSLSEFVKLPLFVNLTSIKDDNLKVALKDSQTIQVGSAISATEVVHSITCYNLSECQLDEFLAEESVLHLNVLRGGESLNFRLDSNLFVKI